MNERQLPPVMQQQQKLMPVLLFLLAVRCACCLLFVVLPAAVLLLVPLLIVLLALHPAACCICCRWDEPKFPLRRPIKETIDKIGEIMGHIEDDLKVCSHLGVALVCCGGLALCAFEMVMTRAIWCG